MWKTEWVIVEKLNIQTINFKCVIKKNGIDFLLTGSFVKNGRGDNIDSI